MSSMMFYCFFTYHSLLEWHYGDKRGKTLTSKEQANTEGLSIWEMENCVDIDMFLDEYPCWEAEGLHCPLILQEMFLQAAHTGRREVEWMIHQGCWHGLLHLDPQADVSAIWSVGPCTSRKEIRDLYYQVYKLRRLPGSLPYGLELAVKLMRDVVFSLKNCLRQKEDEPPRMAQATQPMQNRTPQGQRGGTFAKTHLGKVREAHWRALGTTITLEEW